MTDGRRGPAEPKQGADRSRFEQLVRPVLEPAYRLARSLTHDAADAEDVVQEAALRAFRAFHTFEPGTNFRAWFYRIVTNCAYGRRRTQSRRPQTVTFDDAEALYLYSQTRAAGLHERTNDPAGLLLERIGAERIAEAIASIPEDYRATAALYFLEDYAYQDIAEVLEIPVGTVRSRLHRGRRMLQKALWRLAEEAGLIADLTRTQEQT